MWVQDHILTWSILHTGKSLEHAGEVPRRLNNYERSVRRWNVCSRKRAGQLAEISVEGAAAVAACGHARRSVDGLTLPVRLAPARSVRQDHRAKRARSPAIGGALLPNRRGSARGRQIRNALARRSGTVRGLWRPVPRP